MFARFRKTAPAPTSAASGSNRNTMNSAQAKLSKALNNIAYHHVEKYANAIKVSAKANAAAVKAVNTAAVNPTQTNVKNATLATANAVAAQETVNETEKNAKAAANLTAGVPPPPAAPASVAALNAEAAAVNALIQNIQATNNMNTFLTNRANNISKVPANRKNNVNVAIASRRAALPSKFNS